MITANQLQARHVEQGTERGQALSETLRLIEASIVESGLACDQARSRLSEAELNARLETFASAISDLWFYFAQLAAEGWQPPSTSRPPLRAVGG